MFSHSSIKQYVGEGRKWRKQWDSKCYWKRRTVLRLQDYASFCLQERSAAKRMNLTFWIWNYTNIRQWWRISLFTVLHHQTLQAQDYKVIQKTLNYSIYKDLLQLTELIWKVSSLPKSTHSITRWFRGASCS